MHKIFGKEILRKDTNKNTSIYVEILRLMGLKGNYMGKCEVDSYV
jgi:hypothetical protein